ncbi:cytochrome c biogenesis CcdA family protein [Liberiplasma polymorphum]|uniref:cytochrome c biogenesis CcdA family protein n=1 Tax=Liberiplasma polymorphum TaxID=3374570 RepID=UPI003773C6A8
MDINFLLGGSILAAFVSGFIALLAPCCISVMLPSYISGAAHNKRTLVGFTTIFAFGIATIILPIIMGASYLVGLINTQHMIIYLVGGSMMILLAGFVLLGGELHLPMPARRISNRKGPLGIYSLGVFSGITSSCCAPVLLGLIALSTFTNSFIAVMLLGLAYVLGMVIPLLILTVIYRKYGQDKMKILKVRSIEYKLGPIKKTISSTALATGVLLSLMGGYAIYLGFTEDTMAQPSDWQYQWALFMQRFGKTVTNWIEFVPNWLIAFVVVLVVYKAIRITVNLFSESEESCCEKKENEV